MVRALLGSRTQYRIKFLYKTLNYQVKEYVVTFLLVSLDFYPKLLLRHTCFLLVCFIRYVSFRWIKRNPFRKVFLAQEEKKNWGKGRTLKKILTSQTIPEIMRGLRKWQLRKSYLTWLRSQAMSFKRMAGKDINRCSRWKREGRSTYAPKDSGRDIKQMNQRPFPGWYG